MIVGTVDGSLVVSGVATLALVCPAEMDRSLSSPGTALPQIAIFVVDSLLVAVGDPVPGMGTTPVPTRRRPARIAVAELSVGAAPSGGAAIGSPTPILR